MLPPLPRYHWVAKTPRHPSRLAPVLPSLGDTTVRPFFVPSGHGARRPWAWRLSRRSPSPIFPRRWQGLPGSWGDPHEPMPYASTPAGPQLLALAERRCCPRSISRRGHRPLSCLSGPFQHGLSSRCLRFAARLPFRVVRHHARLACRLVASLCRAGLTPCGVPYERFLSLSTRPPPFPGFGLAREMPQVLPRPRASAGDETPLRFIEGTTDPGD